MIYLITQMAIALIISFILGLFFGWIFRGCFKKKETVIVKKENITQVSTVDNTLDMSNRNVDLRPNSDLSNINDSNNLNKSFLDSGKLTEEEEKIKLGITTRVEKQGFVAPTEIANQYQVSVIEGIGKTYTSRLNEKGIITTEDLIVKCGMNVEEREEIALHVKVVKDVVSSWVSMADLLRVSGVNGQYAELMNRVGVDSVKTLSENNSSDLHSKMKTLNDKHSISPDVPAEDIVANWIEVSSDLSERVKNA